MDESEQGDGCLMSLHQKKLKSGRVSYWAALRYNRKTIWKNAGSVKAEAKRLHDEWRQQIKDGTFDPEFLLSARPKVSQYAEHWLAQRRNRTADKDRSMVRLYVKPQAWLWDMKLEEVRSKHISKLVEAIRLASAVSDKTISNALTTLHTMWRDAIRDEIAGVNPVELPKGTLKTARKKEPEFYQPAEAVVLMRNMGVRPEVRMLWLLLFYTGMRKGEAAGRRWRDCQEALDLHALSVRDQYDGQPLKTERPRVVPIHPELAEALTQWAEMGWPAVYGRAPRPEDFIVPNPRTLLGLTDHASYELLFRSAVAVGVKWRGVHGCRHTFVTMARRAGCHKEDYTRITHNPKGDIVDGYTAATWEPLCKVIRSIAFDANQQITPTMGNGGKIAFLSTSKKADVPTDGHVFSGRAGLRSPSAPQQKPAENEGQKRPRQNPVKNSRIHRETVKSVPAWALAYAARAVGVLPVEVAA
jgi:integrase